MIREISEMSDTTKRRRPTNLDDTSRHCPFIDLPRICNIEERLYWKDKQEAYFRGGGVERMR